MEHLSSGVALRCDPNLSPPGLTIGRSHYAITRTTDTVQSADEELPGKQGVVLKHGNALVLHHADLPAPLHLMVLSDERRRGVTLQPLSLIVPILRMRV